MNSAAPRTSYVLGAGAEIAEIKARNWQTKAAQNDRDAARAEGFLPLLTHEHEQVKAMAAALRRHPVASALFNPEQRQARAVPVLAGPRRGDLAAGTA